MLQPCPPCHLLSMIFVKLSTDMLVSFQSGGSSLRSLVNPAGTPPGASQPPVWSANRPCQTSRFGYLGNHSALQSTEIWQADPIAALLCEKGNLLITLLCLLCVAFNLSRVCVLCSSYHHRLCALILFFWMLAVKFAGDFCVL